MRALRGSLVEIRPAMTSSGNRRNLPIPDVSSTNPRTRRLRRGERRRLTREDINADIRRKEEELTNLLETRNALKKKQRDQRTATMAAYREKDSNQAEVNRSYKDISAKSEEMNRIKAVLIYQRGDRHDDAINKIEMQLRVNNFKLSDEKRLVQEIDALRKSKRDLSKYQQMRASLDDIRARQRSLKAERDELFQKIKISKKEEEELKRKVSEMLPGINQVKRSIEELQLRRQQLDVGASSGSGDEGCPPAGDSERSEAVPAPGSAAAAGDVGASGGGEAPIPIAFEDFSENTGAETDSQELAALARSLITYLRSLLPDWASVVAAGAADSGPNAAPDNAAAPVALSSPSASAAAVSALVGAKCLGPKEQNRRRPLGHKLQRSERVLTHKPDVFAKFDRLAMQPPSRLVEIPDCIQKLSAFAESQGEADVKTSAAAPKLPAVGYARSLSNPSNDESGFSETTSVRPESPELGSTRSVPAAMVFSPGHDSEPEASPGPSSTTAGHDDLLSTSSTICSEDVASSSTESPPLPVS